MTALTCARNDLVDFLLPTIFTLDREGDTFIVTSVGDDRQLTDEEFNAALENLKESVDPNISSVVVDMNGAEVHTSDRLIGPLIVLWNRVRGHNGKMAICGLDKYGQEVLRRTRLHLLWQICPSREAALRKVSA